MKFHLICVQCGYMNRCEAILHYSEEMNFDDIIMPECFQGMTKDYTDVDKSIWERIE